MDNEQLADESMHDQDTAPSADEAPSADGGTSLDETSPFAEALSDKPERSSTALVWRILALGVALVIIVVLAYPFIQQQLQRDENLSTSPLVSPAEAPALETEANSPEEWFELGKDYYKQNQWSQAVAAFQKVVELDPTYQAAYANLGAAYHRQNNLDLAVTQYQKALELNPEDGLQSGCRLYPASHARRPARP